VQKILTQRNVKPSSSNGNRNAKYHKSQKRQLFKPIKFLLSCDLLRSDA